jgi:tetratricopeptide repeat protein 30
MRSLEKEEETEMSLYPSKHVYHLCIVNLVIGTLYVSKGNLEFGLQRVMKSLEPFEKKVNVFCYMVSSLLMAVSAWH